METVIQIQYCLNVIFHWMNEGRLKLNTDFTEVIINDIIINVIINFYHSQYVTPALSTTTQVSYF